MGQDRRSRAVAVGAVGGPLLLLTVYTLSYPFMPPLVEPLAPSLVAGYTRNYAGIANFLERNWLLALLTAVAGLAGSLSVYTLCINRTPAWVRILLSTPIWPLATFLIFESHRDGEQFSKIAIYFSILLSLLSHICAETSFMRRWIPERAGREAVDLIWSLQVGVAFVLLVILVPPLFLLARFLGVQSHGTNLATEWLAVGTFSVYALAYCLMLSFWFLRIPTNVLYLLKLPPWPLSVFISYAAEDLRTVKAVSESLRDHGIIVHDYSDQIAGGEKIRPWVEDRIRGSDFVVVVVSGHSLESQWVYTELQLAESLGKPVLPFAATPIETLPLQRSAVGKALADRNIITGSDLGVRLIRLMEAVRDTAVLTRPTGTGEGTVPEPGTIQRGPR